MKKSNEGLFATKWEGLPEHLRTDQQLAGVAAVGCGATHGVMERCNFACTSCYLSDVANRTPPLEFAEVKGQLNDLLDHLGSGGKVQITSGEVTLLSKHELGRIVAYARSIGLDPMVMTNGQRFLQTPDYLRTLVEQYGLEKVSIHIDTTQRGRPGMDREATEQSIHPIRDRFARLLRDVRKKSGKPLHAAQTVIVTSKNLNGVSDIVSWTLDNLDVFRILSFLPVAEVGRTEDHTTADLTLDEVWELVCRGMGRPLHRHALHYGHPGCNITVPVVIVRIGGGATHIIELAREGNCRDRRFVQRALREFAPHLDFDGNLWSNARALLQRLVLHPRRLVECVLYGSYRFWGERQWVWKIGFGLLGRGRIQVRPLMLVVHKFMSAEELNTPLGRERLQACVFKVPVGGKLVSMCQMNATDLRRNLNQQQQSHAILEVSPT